MVSNVNAQEWLNEKYPVNETCKRKSDQENKGKKREEITELDISEQNLEGSLNLTDFVNLIYLNCSDNKLTKLDLTGLSHLVAIGCFNNYLTNINYPLNAEQLTHLLIFNNNLSEQDCSVFSRFINLETLAVGNWWSRTKN